jgi:putative transposase
MSGNLNDTEYARIAPLLEPTSHRERPCEISYREIINAIFYVLKTGCGWRELPHDLPKWQTVYYYFRQFRLYGLWEEINERVCQAVREKEGRRAEPTAMIIDCQSVKSAEGGEAIGFDSGKKVHGRKRVLLTDTLGFGRLVKVVAADTHVGSYPTLPSSVIPSGLQSTIEEKGQRNGLLFFLGCWPGNL